MHKAASAHRRYLFPSSFIPIVFDGDKNGI